MRLTLTILTMVAALPAGSAMADDDCFVPMADWKPREAVAKMAADLGWTVRRIKIDDGCYELRVTDTSGNVLKVKIDPATLEVVDGSVKRFGDGSTIGTSPETELD